MNYWAAFYEYVGAVEVEGLTVDLFRHPVKGTYWYQTFQDGKWLWQSWSVWHPYEDDFEGTRMDLQIPPT